MAHDADSTYDASSSSSAVDDSDQVLAAVMSTYHKQNKRPVVGGVEPSAKKNANPLAVFGMPTSAQMQDYYNPNGTLIYPSGCMVAF